MHQYSQMFGVTRIPAKDADHLVQFDKSLHIVVSAKSHFFVVFVNDQFGNRIAVKEIEACVLVLIVFIFFSLLVYSNLPSLILNLISTLNSISKHKSQLHKHNRLTFLLEPHSTQPNPCSPGPPPVYQRIPYRNSNRRPPRRLDRSPHTFYQDRRVQQDVSSLD